uniref:Uncharacterized protein n=1 Tax=Oryza punctata TaxID=4537 RepID=A0A0E0LBF2_ORYPU
MQEQSPWETLDPFSHEAPGGNFSMAYSVSDEEFLHRSNFGKAVPAGEDLPIRQGGSTAPATTRGL